MGIGWDFNRFVRELYLKPAVTDDFALKTIADRSDQIKGFLQSREICREELGLECDVSFYEHHLCHTKFAQMLVGEENVSSLVVDGFGDLETTSFWNYTNGNFIKVWGENYPKLTWVNLFEHNRLLGFYP